MTASRLTLSLCLFLSLAGAAFGQRGPVAGVTPARAALTRGALNPPTGLTATPSGTTVVLAWTPPSGGTQAHGFHAAGMLDEVEPNNARSTAQPLGGAAPVVVNGNAEVEDQGDLIINFTDGTTDDLEDLFVFTLTADGVTITLDDLVGDCDLYLLSPDLMVRGTSTRIGLDGEDITDATLAAGTYFLGVTLFDDDPITSPTPYTLALSGTLADGPVTSLQAYRVYRSGGPGAAATGALIAEVASDTTTFVDLPATPAPLFYQVTALYDLGESGPSNEAEVSNLVTALDDGPGLPATFALEQNFPNPFTPHTTIPYRLSATTDVRLDLYDLRGRHIRTLVHQNQPAGIYAARWDGRTETGTFAPSGVYFYRIRTPQFEQTRALLLLR